MSRVFARLGITAAALVAGLFVAGCSGGGKSSSPSPSPSVPTESSTSARPPVGRIPQNVRLAMVTHGQASDTFWSVVRAGVDEAARDLGVSVSYQAPDIYDPARMSRLIDAAVGSAEIQQNRNDNGYNQVEHQRINSRIGGEGYPANM